MMKRLHVCDGQRQEDGHQHFILNLKAACLWFVSVTHSLPTFQMENTRNILAKQPLKNLCTKPAKDTHTHTHTHTPLDVCVS